MQSLQNWDQKLQLKTRKAKVKWSSNIILMMSWMESLRNFLTKTTKKAKIKLKAKKYNPATRKHEIFVEKKLPPHSK